MVPYADFNLLKFPDKAQAMAKIRDLTMLSDILPTGFHGAVTAGVGVGSVVYIAGAGPVGLAAAASAQILGAAVVLIGDMNQERLAHAKSVGFEPVDLTQSDRLEDLIAQIVAVPEVDASVDAVGFEAHGHGSQSGQEAPATVLNSLMTITRPGGAIGIPGLYVTEGPGAKDDAAQQGNLRMRFGWGGPSRTASRPGRHRSCATTGS
jgi:glutathione-independent formaldehyde dehydrogenase